MMSDSAAEDATRAAFRAQLQARFCGGKAGEGLTGDAMERALDDALVFHKFWGRFDTAAPGAGLEKVVLDNGEMPFANPTAEDWTAGEDA